MFFKLAFFLVVVITKTSAYRIYDNDALMRPSPINPLIPMDLKPVETVTIITDPKELAKYKREIHNETPKHTITAPTTVHPIHEHSLNQQNSEEHKSEPNKQIHNEDQRSKRDTKTATSSAPSLPFAKENSHPAQVKPTTAAKPVAATSASTAIPKRKRQRPSSTTTTVKTPKATQAAQEIKHRQKRDENVVATVPLIYRDEHKQPNSYTHTNEDASVRPQTLPAPLSAPEHQSHHPQNIPTNFREGTAHPQTLPFLFEHDKHTEIKRDIPVPLVPKYHHPEQSPTSVEEKKHVEVPKDAVSVKTPTTLSSNGEHSKRATEDIVQVEELSEAHNQKHQPSSTGQPPIRHDMSTSTTTTEHSIFRHRPVPVAELFGKPHTTTAT